MLWHICIAPLPDTVDSVALWHGPWLMDIELLPPFTPSSSRAEPHLKHLHPNFQQQSSTLFTSCFIFHRPRKDGIAWFVKLESAASGSWTRAAGVRGECATSRPPARTIIATHLLHGSLGDSLSEDFQQLFSMTLLSSILSNLTWKAFCSITEFLTPTHRDPAWW